MTLWLCPATGRDRVAEAPRAAKLLVVMVGPTELESVTSCVSSRRSNQLSYGPVRKQKTYYGSDL